MRNLFTRLVNFAGKSPFHAVSLLVIIAVTTMLAVLAVDFVLFLHHRLEAGWILFSSILETALRTIFRELSELDLSL